ncbi:MAG: hypothetical protein IJF74_04835 [Clostridia bacterium]|nr:hypothetical protein [Clostridia bacterium]
MKKALTIAVSLLLTFVFLAAPVCAANLDPEALGEYGQKVHDVNYTATKPKLDGKISEGEYGALVYSMLRDSTDNCQYFSGITDVAAVAQYLPSKSDLYFSYDKNTLYIAAIVTDEVHCVKVPGVDGWNGDALEVDLSLDFNGTTTGMMNRFRITYNISKEGIPHGYVHNAPNGYGAIAALTTLTEGYDFAISRDEEAKTTTYEIALYWSDLSGSNEVPTKIFINCQFHLAHPDYNNGDYMGAWRYAAKLPEGADEKVGWALHIYNIDTSVFAKETQAPATTEAPKTDAPATDAPATDAPATDAPATDAPATNAPATNAPSTQKPADTDKGNSTPIIIGVVAAVVVIAVVVFFVIKKRK